MRVHRLKLKSMPRIVHAHENASDNYAWDFAPLDNFLEVSYRLENEIYLTCDGVTEKVPPRSVCVGYRTKHSSTRAEGFQRHVTVGFEIELESVPEGEEDEETLILPNFSILPNSESFLKMLREIVEEFTIKHTTTPSLCGKILTMLAQIDAEYRMLSHAKHSELHYAEEAKRYIVSHLHEKIYVTDVADHVGLSVGYLSNVFRKATGQTLVEYINVTKLRFVKELIDTYQISIREAGARAGFSDENYVSRIYKRYFGKNITEE